MLKPPILACLMVCLLCFSVFTAIGPALAQSNQKGPFIDEARFILRSDENIALEEVKAGDLDMYYFRIPLEAAGDAANDPRLKVHERTAGSMGFFVNPAPSPDGATLNPFASKEARHALNFLINRDFMVQEILRGYGTPMYDAFGIYSPEYLNIIDVVESFGIRYNPSLANSIISSEMTTAGAEKTDGKWTYNGNPVTVTIVIRQDDAPRKSMGELMSSELENIGFTVVKDYGDLNTANSIVYGSDPADLQWHLYTEGFAGTSVFVKYNPTVPAQMYAPWFGRMPGSGNEEFWNYENTTLDQVTEAIMFNFTSQEHRTELVRSAVMMGMQESVRLFVAQKTDPFVASSEIDGLVNDFGAGITSKYSLANAVHTAGDKSLDIGMKQIHQGSWNSIGGLQDTYSRDVHTNVADSGTYRHPYTGEVIPMRGEWTDVATEGPLGQMDVEQDAVVWDPVSEQWTNVDEGTKSKSRVTFKLLYSNWHHGIPMDISDFMFSEYFAYEWGTNEGENDVTVDGEFTPQAEVSLQYTKGVKFGVDEIVNYVDYWHYDETEIADFGVFWVNEPWEVTAAAERAVIDGKFAFSRSDSTEKVISWYDPLVKDHADIISDELQDMKNENYVPIALRDVVTQDEAAARYDAAMQWIETHGHAIISNGGFYLDNFNPAGGTITIKAFRDPTYPFEAGHWSEFREPKLATITNVDSPRSVTLGQPATVTIGVAVAGEPSNNADVDYFVSDRGGSLILKGKAAPEDGGTFRVDLSGEDTQKFSVGPNQLRLFATGWEATRPAFSTHPILATASGSSSNQTGNNGGTTPTPTGPAPSGCLIATAAFGSELSPQVQYLRNFREQYILSTAAGSAFMNAFNSAYYSFSPQVADYERDQPWLQTVVKAGLYPLFGILMVSERAHFGAGGGEAGAIASGTVAAALIGAVYLWPAAFSTRLQSRFSSAGKVLVILLVASFALTLAGIASASELMLSIGTPMLVLSLASISALTVGRLARTAYSWIKTSRL